MEIMSQRIFFFFFLVVYVESWENCDLFFKQKINKCDQFINLCQFIQNGAGLIHSTIITD